jgi:hypothetical protein
MTTALTEKEYKSTMAGRMIDVTDTAEPIVDIWPYVEELASDKIVPEQVFNNELVESVYQNEDGSFHHVLLPTEDQDIFIVLVIDVTERKIRGNFKLDFEYAIRTLAFYN